MKLYYLAWEYSSQPRVRTNNGGSVRVFNKKKKVKKYLNMLRKIHSWPSQGGLKIRSFEPRNTILMVEKEIVIDNQIIQLEHCLIDYRTLLDLI